MKDSIPLLQQLAKDFDFSGNGYYAIWVPNKGADATRTIRQTFLQEAPELQRCFWFCDGSALLGRRFNLLVILVDSLYGLDKRQLKYFEESVRLKLSPDAKTLIVGSLV